MINTMQRLKMTLAIFSSFFILLSCQPDEKQLLVTKINDLEKTLFENKKGIIDTKEASNMIHAYKEFADQYPQDTMSPKYLFKAADVSINTFHSVQTVKIFDRIITEYPDFEKVPQAMFLKAFTFENYLNDIEKAKKYYLEFIAKYPDHPFTNDAQISLQNLGKSPEEIIKAFKAVQKK